MTRDQADKDEAPAEELPNLAERLDALFTTVPRGEGDRRLHSSASAAQALEEQGISVTPNHIRALRNGTRSNPSFRLLTGLAGLFHVPLDYFVDDAVANEVQESLQALVAMRDSGVQQVMMRAHGISSESLGPVLALLDQIRKIESLDAAGESKSSPRG